MNQPTVKEILDLMQIQKQLLDWDMLDEANHVLSLISTLTLSLAYTGIINPPPQ